MNLRTVIFMGRSGSGKGTQVKLLVEHMVKGGVNGNDILTLSSGDLFRQFSSRDGYTHGLVKRELSDGHRLPDFLAVKLWADFFVDKYHPGTHLFLDGFPRSYGQALMFEDTLTFYEREAIDVLHLDVSEKWCIDHLAARGRADDLSIDVIKQRLAFYESDVRDALAYYRKSSHIRFHEVNGEQSIDGVHADVLKTLGLGN